MNTPITVESYKEQINLIQSVSPIYKSPGGYDEVSQVVKLLKRNTDLPDRINVIFHQAAIEDIKKAVAYVSTTGCVDKVDIYDCFTVEEMLCLKSFTFITDNLGIADEVFEPKDYELEIASKRLRIDDDGGMTIRIKFTNGAKVKGWVNHLDTAFGEDVQIKE